MAAAWPVPASALCARRWNDYLAAEAVFLAGVSSLPGSIGAVAFSRTGDPLIGEFGDARLLKKFGAVPDDLSGL